MRAKKDAVISFVHAADLHLDSPFVNLREADEDIADLLREATFKAFDNVVNVCLERAADFLLVAGDVYDGADRSLKAQLAFRAGLQRLSNAGIASYVVHGNHDPLDGWASSLKWPEKVHIFGGEDVESVPYRRDGQERAIIHGISFPRRDVEDNLARRFKAVRSSLPQIGLLHCNVGHNTAHEPYAPCSLDDLREAGLDYWALGHVHNRGILSRDNPGVVYAGNTQGRHVNECGQRGCFHIEVEERKEIRTEFIPVDAVRWTTADIHIGPLDTEESLLSVLEERLHEIHDVADGRPCVCTSLLHGRGVLHRTLQRPGYADDLLVRMREHGRGLIPLVWLNRIDVRTGGLVDVQSRRRSEDIVGDLLRLAHEYKENPGSLNDLRERLAELYEQRPCREYLQTLNNQEILSLLEDAESLCLDMLLKEDSG